MAQGRPDAQENNSAAQSLVRGVPATCKKLHPSRCRTHPAMRFQGRPGRGTQGACGGQRLLKLCRLYIESNSMTAGTAPIRDPLLACIDGKQAPITEGGASVGDVVACPGDRTLTEAGVG